MVIKCKPATRKGVGSYERLGYRQMLLRGLASKRTTTVGVIIPDISSAFFSELPWYRRYSDDV